MILLASDVTEQVDAGKAASDYADGHLAELELDDRGHCEDDPHEGHRVAGRPEDHRVRLVGHSGLTQRLEVPSLFAFIVNFAPPAQPDQDPASEVLDDPEVEGAKNDHDQEAEGLVVNEKAQDEVANERQKFKCNVQHAVAWMSRSFQKARDKLLIFVGEVGRRQLMLLLFARGGGRGLLLPHQLVGTTSHGVHLFLAVGGG